MMLKNFYLGLDYERNVIMMGINSAGLHSEFERATINDGDGESNFSSVIIYVVVFGLIGLFALFFYKRQ